jgi:hypothetical protein
VKQSKPPSLDPYDALRHRKDVKLSGRLLSKYKDEDNDHVLTRTWLSLTSYFGCTPEFVIFCEWINWMYLPSIPGYVGDPGPLHNLSREASKQILLHMLERKELMGPISFPYKPVDWNF